MKKNCIKITCLAFCAATLFSSCKKEDTVTPAVPGPTIQNPDPGEYILTEGSYGSNNTKLGYYSNTSGIFSDNFFVQQNPALPAGLGDTGNDMIIYGSKMYIVMNNSARVTVMRAANATFLANISFLNGTANKFPRYAVGARGKVYVSASDNTVSVIDTTTLAIIKTIPVGANPEGMAASANYLYVANSGGFNPAPDSTVSLVDLNTETEIRKIKVGVNPNKVEINSAGNVYVSAYGNFSSIPASVSMINGSTNITSVNLGAGFAYSHLRISHDTAYFYNNYGGAGTSKVYNTISGAVIRNEFVTDGTIIQTPYGINIDEQTGDVYIADAVNYTAAGKITCFTSAGVKKFSFSTGAGINPNKIIFKR